jgi:hypothetical protein
MLFSKSLPFLLISICIISIACASVQISSVKSLEETTRKEPQYLNRTLYIYTLKDEVLPRRTYNRSEIPWYTELRKKTFDFQYQYGSYAEVMYEEIHEREYLGMEEINGFIVILVNGQNVFVSDTLQNNYKLKVGSNIEYAKTGSVIIIKKVDGRKIK